MSAHVDRLDLPLVEVVTFTKVTFCRDEGVVADPARVVHLYCDDEGNPVFEHDTYTGQVIFHDCPR